MFFDFTQDITIPISVTIRESLIKAIDIIVEDQQKRQPKYKKKINRSSVMTILLASSLEANADESESIKLAVTKYLETMTYET